MAGVIIGDTAHQAMIMHASYTYQIINFGDEIFINKIVMYVLKQVQQFVLNVFSSQDHHSKPLINQTIHCKKKKTLTVH